MNRLEFIGFAFGIAGVWLTIKKNTWCFPVGIVNVVITAWLVYMQQLYADVLQQLVYLVLLIYGWIVWYSGKAKVTEEISTLSIRQSFLIVTLMAVSSVMIGYFLKSFTNASFPYADSTGTVLCFMAQWLVAVKKLENWYFWIVANVMYMVIYYMKDLPFYAVLSGIYLLMACYGLKEWKIAWEKKTK